MIINFTGQPESGKTTLSKLLQKELKFYYPEHKVIILDGDVIRKVTNNYDYTEEGRRRNITSAYAIATGLIQASLIDENFKTIVILAIISPYRELRETLKERMPVLEYYLTSTRNSRAQNNVEGYEEPLINFTHVNTDTWEGTCVRNMVSDIKAYLQFQNTKA